MDKGFFGGLFDFNHDGELDPMERAMDFMAFDEMMKESDASSDDEDEDLTPRDAAYKIFGKAFFRFGKVFCRYYYSV